MAARLRCFISGTEYIMTDRYSIKEQAGQTATATIPVRLDSNPVPSSQELVEIKQEDLTPIYTGIIQIVESPKWSTQFETEIYTLNVKALEVIFSQRLVNEAIQNMYVHEIIDYIFDEYLLEEGLTKGTITVFDTFYKTYVSNGLTVQQIFDELGDAVQGVAKISPSLVFSFTSSEDFISVTAPTHIKFLKLKDSGQSLRTVQRLTGASEETNLLTDTQTWLVNQTTLTLGYQVKEITGMTINGSPAGVGILGVDETDTSKTFLYNFGKNTVTVNNSASVKPTTGDIVGTVYYGFYDIDILVENENLKLEIASLNGTSGKIEAISSDTSITNVTDGETQAQAILDQYGTRERTLTGGYRSSELLTSAILSLWTLDYPGLGIVGQFVVVERTLTDFYEESNIKIKLKSRNFYSRYGTILQKDDKSIKNLTVRTDVTVAKVSNVIDGLEMCESYDLDSAGVIFYPEAATGGELVAPVGLDGFFPIGEYIPAVTGIRFIPIASTGGELWGPVGLDGFYPV